MLHYSGDWWYQERKPWGRNVPLIGSEIWTKNLKLNRKMLKIWRDHYTWGSGLKKFDQNTLYNDNPWTFLNNVGRFHYYYYKKQWDSFTKIIFIILEIVFIYFLLFYILKFIWKDHEDKIKFGYQINTIKEQFQILFFKHKNRTFFSIFVVIFIITLGILLCPLWIKFKENLMWKHIWKRFRVLHKKANPNQGLYSNSFKQN